MYEKHCNGGSRKHSIRPGERGQTMVEMAFVLPLFLIFVFAIIEIGRAWGAKQSLTIAAREGARILTLPYGPSPTYKYTSEDEVLDAALNEVKDSMNSSGVPVTKSTLINRVRIRPGSDGVFNTGDDEVEPYNATLSPPVKRGDRVGIQIRYPFETPAPILLTMFESGGGALSESVINIGVICYMEHE